MPPSLKLPIRVDFSGTPAISSKVLTVSEDKTMKVWDIMDDGNGKLKCTLAFPSSGGVDDMQVHYLWHGDHLVTVSLNINGSFSSLLISYDSRLTTHNFEHGFCSSRPRTKTACGRCL
ncbi:uncharacterized protein LOC110111937 [Dendrobium catenatum]|uniref:uncharacterized protein LOC110111937 n=1 Tax=Dendrobium catenatum TaxID=906689 RepID=UPI0009F5E9DD|nr:uncharacterized protein LOC110111937 [Dendrobium catenatum]